MVSAPRTPPEAIRAASAVTDVSTEQRSDANCTLAGSTSTFSHRLFFGLALVSYRPLAGTPPGLFAPGLNTRAGTSPRALQEFAVAPKLVLCLASRLPAQGRIYLDSFTLRAEHRLLLLTHSFTIGCAWRAQPTPWVSNPSRYPAVTREAALIRSAARHPLFRGGGAALFAAAPAILCFAAALSATPAILFRAKALFCSGA